MPRICPGPETQHQSHTSGHGPGLQSSVGATSGPTTTTTRQIHQFESLVARQQCAAMQLDTTTIGSSSSACRLDSTGGLAHVFGTTAVTNRHERTTTRTTAWSFRGTVGPATTSAQDCDASCNPKNVVLDGITPVGCLLVLVSCHPICYVFFSVSP